MRRTVIREGIVAGVLGATAVAIWFLMMDVIFRQAFFTPLGLGHGLVAVFAPGREYAPALYLVWYTLFHYAAFIVVATVAAVIVDVGERQPVVLAGAFLLFVATEIGFYGLSSMLAHSTVFQALGWFEVLLGNLIAAFVMGTYLWRAHPGLKAGLNAALGDQV
jgi:hypothetical protein